MDNTKASNKLIEKTALSIINTDGLANNVHMDYWNRYNSSFAERFNYLTKVGEFDLPMQERNVPLQRRLLDLLVAKKTRRPFSYSVYMDGEDIRKKKIDDKVRGFIDHAIMRSEEAAFEKDMRIDALDQQMSQIQQMVGQAQESGQQIPPEQMLQMQQFIKQLQFVRSNMNKQKVLNDEVVEEYNMLLKNSPKEILEKIVTRYMKYLQRTIDFNSISTYQFRNRVVTGHQNYLVAKFDSEKPIIKGLKSHNVFYQKGGEKKHINEKDWAYYSETMSFTQVLENFSEEFIDKYGMTKLLSLRDMYSPSTPDAHMWALPDGGAIFGNQFTTGEGEVSTDKVISIKWVWFRAGVPISRKVSIDKHGNEHKHIVVNKTLIRKEDYKYSKGVYYNKKDEKNSYKKGEVILLSKESGDRVETKVLKKIYHAIVIDDEYVVNEMEWKHVVRNVDNYNRLNLPIFGPAFDDLIDRPYSLIKATNDIQDLIDIVWTSREYMIAVAGTKGNVIDVSQKPDDMTTPEWEYQIKLGRIYIQTVDANGVPKRTSFNQWQNFDNSVSQSIQYYDNMIQSLTAMMGSIIGIPYQALGETTRTDQVGTNKMAVQESQMITEMLFYDHHIVDKKVLEEYLSLAVKEANGEDVVFSEPNLSSTTDFLLKTKLLDGVDLKINLYSQSDDLQQIQELKSMSIQMQQSLGLSFSNLVKIWNSDTLKEMEAKVEFFEEQSRKVASEQANAAAAAEADQLKETKKFETEMEVYLEQMKAKFKESDNMVQQAKLIFDKEKFEFETKIEQAKLQLEAKKVAIDEMKMRGDAATEEAMLLHDDKHNTFDDNLRALELQINTMFEAYRLGIEGARVDLEDKKLGIESKKVSVAAQSSAKKSSKTHVNDN